MKLSEKIAMLRKEKHWSQEELAMRLDISRQSVSKWESDASIPDLDKVVRLSEIFDVSTDFLLKEDPAAEEAMLQERKGSEDFCGNDFQEKEPEEEVPVIFTVEEAGCYIDLNMQAFRRISLGVSLCIISPIAVILLAGMTEYGMLAVTEDQAGGIGLIILFLLIAAAVVLFILDGMQLSKYEFLERELVVLTDDCRVETERRKQEFEPTYRGCIAAGVTICILSVIPIFTALAFNAGDVVYLFAIALLLLIVAVGVCPIIYSAGIWGSYEKLLQVGEYTPEKKRSNKRNETIGGIYWCIITTGYLAVSFYTMSWHRTWIIWPCAGVLYAAICGIINIRFAGRK